MLSSINPLGERGRNSRYALTVVAYVIASVAGGLVTGSGLGALGKGWLRSHTRRRRRSPGWCWPSP